VRRALALAAVACLALAAETSADAAEQPAQPKIADPNGTEVTFKSTRLDTEILLAHGDVEKGTYPDPFEKIGVATVTVKLAPGAYTIETISPSTSLGYERIRVGTTSMTIEVRPGDELVKTLGGVFAGLGVTSILAGVIVAVAVSPHDQSFNRWAIAGPMFIGGGVALLAGFGLTLLGSTTFVLPSASAQGLGAQWVVRF
jgi:hypothetical protein